MALWSYLFNIFMSVTTGKYQLCHDIIKRWLQNMASATDEEVIAIREFLKGNGEKYMTAFEQYVNSRTSLTPQQIKEFQEALATVQPKMEDWKEWLHVLAKQNNDLPFYNVLFPGDKITFYTDAGTDSLTVDRIKQFNTNLQGSIKPFYAPVKTQVAALATLLGVEETQRNASDADKGKEYAALEPLRVELCYDMYAAKGKFESHFSRNPEMIEQYIPVELLVRSQQEDFVNNHVAGGQAVLVFSRTYEGTQQFRIRNLGTTVLHGYRVAQKDAAPAPGVGIHLQPGEEILVAASALGEGRFYYIFNEDVDAEGGYAFDVV